MVDEAKCRDNDNKEITFSQRKKSPTTNCSGALM
jgi:hypothetical protein